jgi:hypothetical protein
MKNDDLKSEKLAEELIRISKLKYQDSLAGLSTQKSSCCGRGCDDCDEMNKEIQAKNDCSEQSLLERAKKGMAQDFDYDSLLKFEA